MPSRGIHFAAFAIVVSLLAFAYFGAQALKRGRARENGYAYSALARILNQHARRETCDDQLAQRRYFGARVLDRFRADILGLWSARTGEKEPQFTLLDLGTIKLRISPKTLATTGYDSSAWSWDEVYGLIQRTQGGGDHADRWRDVDSMVRFLLEKDYGRIVLGRKFLAPELTQHRFRPNGGVTRTGPREFTVRLDPGELRGHEHYLQNILESEWQSHGFRVRIQWVGGEAYRLLTHHDSSRSFVNHRKRTMEIANLAWTRTVAHELGHVLGFDDHYYNVWNGRNCYYSQESRLGDLMSNSEKGKVTARHWQLLDQAYPWGAPARRESFVYLYGK